MIIRRKSDNIVTHAGDLQLTDTGLWANGAWNPTLNTITCEQLDVSDLPNLWAGNKYTYTEAEGFQLADQAWYDELVIDAKNVKCQQINQEKNNRIAQGMTYTFPDGTGTAQLRDNTDMRNIQGLATRGMRLDFSGDTTTTIPFRDAENVTHQLTGAQMVAFGEAVADYVQGYYTASWKHKDAVNALTTMADVQAYDFSN